MGALAVVFALLITAPATACAQEQQRQQEQTTTAAPTPYGTGFIENIQWNRADHSLTVSGWVAPQAQTVFVTNLQIRINNQPIYQGRFERLERPDVVQNTGRQAWLWSGFTVQVKVPASISGENMQVTAAGRLGSGQWFDLQTAATAAPLTIAAPASPSTIAMMGLVLAVLLPVAAWCSGLWRLSAVKEHDGQAQTLPRARWFALSVAMSFALLVAGGWTGSSIGLLFKNNPLASYASQPWLGSDLPVRSDEWAVLTPLVWAQHQHQPRYPVVNQHIGSQGQNMMVVGMTGVPVAHVSSLAKPATWGFFIGDMARGLAWHWWFPFFAAFAALCAVVVRFFGVPWPIASALTLTLTASGYAVGWSGWAAYALFFAMAGALALTGLLKARKAHHALTTGVFLGWSIAGFGLVLYPAWQISLAHVVLPMVLAWVASQLWAQRTSLHRLWWPGAGLLLGVVVAAALLGAWWLDAHSAVQAMRDTIYPGGRSAEAGGDIDPWFFLKGWLSPVTMYINQSSLIVPSDAASVVFVLPALWVAVLREWWLARKPDAISVAVALSACFMVLFMYWGLPPLLARYSGMALATSYRMDIALGLAQTLLWAWLLGVAYQRRTSATAEPSFTAPATGRGWLVVCAALSAVLALWTWQQYQWLPVAISQWVSPGFIAMCCAAVAVCSYAIMQGHHRTALAVVLVWTISATLGFNPLGTATQRVTATPALQQHIAEEHSTIAVLGPAQWAMALQATGAHVVGGVYYYPQFDLWRALDPTGQYRSVYNRYHRLQFHFQTLPQDQAAYQLSTPRLDEVRLTLDPARFDFQLLGADKVLAPAEQAAALDTNPTLRTLAMDGAWALYQVWPTPEASTKH